MASRRSANLCFEGLRPVFTVCIVNINLLVTLMETQCVYCEVGTELVCTTCVTPSDNYCRGHSADYRKDIMCNVR
jgi:hypothetical protein